MNSFSTTAQGHANIRNIQAGCREIIRSAFNRSKLWLLARFLAFLILACWVVSPAQANGVVSTIGNGEIVTGRVTGPGATNYDTYTISVPSGAYIFAGLSEVGTHDATFVPEVELDKPNGTLGVLDASSLYAGVNLFNVTGGTWTVYAYRNSGGTSGGFYPLQVIVVPGNVAVAGGNPGGLMYPGVTYSGSIFRNAIDVYTFTAVAGQSYTATVTDTGGTSYTAWMQILTPTGTNGATVITTTNNFHTATAVAGTYTLLLGRDEFNNPNTGTYTVEVTGAGVDMPMQSKGDGATCIPCEAAKKSMVAGGQPPAQSGGVVSNGAVATP